MGPAHIAEAAKLFAEARRTGKPLRELPPSCTPANAEDVNAIVDAVTATISEKIVGWKLGLLYAPRQRPMLCPLFASRVFDSPARIPLSLTPARLMEPEVCFRLVRDLGPRATSYTVEEVAVAVIACPAIEVIDTRFDTAFRSVRQMLDERSTRLAAFADHNTTGAYVVGDGREDWRSLDYAAMRVTMRSSSRTIVVSVGGHAFVDPFLPCVILANEMRHRGGMHKGQIMVTGSFTGFFEVGADETVTADFAGLGRAEATIVNGK